MLIVQRITTEWTKASRGADAATARNATPAALKLLPPARPAPQYLLHDVRCLERDDFECRAQVVEADVSPYLNIEPLFLYVTNSAVAVRFVWTWHHCGAPERASHDLFQLSYGQWGRFTCNGRFGAQSSSGREWGYHKTVFNIALTDLFDENIFLNTVPTAEDSSLAALR